jgi:hypothetical protein
MAMMESLMIGAALWLATQRKRTSPAPYRNRRDSLTRMPGTYGPPAEWSWGDDRGYRDGSRDRFPSDHVPSFTLSYGLVERSAVSRRSLDKTEFS